MTQDPLENQELLSLSQAAEYSGLSHEFLRQLAGKGRLHAKKFGKTWMTTRVAIDEYLQGRGPGGRKPKSQREI